MEEAEELLIKAWTTDNLDFKGKYWQVSFPSVRPRPYQKPHPPLARACIQDESIIEMARIGRPILLRGSSITSVGEKIELYRDTMSAAGFDEQAVEKNLDQIWVWREMHLAETDDQALGEFLPAHHQAYSKMEEIRQQWNPSDLPMSIQGPPMGRSGYGDSPDPGAPENLIGSPRRVAEQVAMMRDAGVRNLMLTNRGLMSRSKTATSLKLLSEKVMPLFGDV
jgi:alkanesulfonate monooxygenase SsuD/methylene tetrahydromethanopterin reductase-like flavin-dependent oxidoreductase (luciferase family)